MIRKRLRYQTIAAAVAAQMVQNKPVDIQILDDLRIADKKLTGLQAESFFIDDLQKLSRQESQSPLRRENRGPMLNRGKGKRRDRY